MDKQHGHLHLDTHEKMPDIDWEREVAKRIEEVNGPDLPPRAFEAKPDGYYKDKQFVPNGNLILGTECSYCDEKHKCWDNIRTFIYSNGPKYFVHIKEGKEPKVFEVKGEVIDDE